MRKSKIEKKLLQCLYEKTEPDSGREGKRGCDAGGQTGIPHRFREKEDFFLAVYDQPGQIFRLENMEYAGSLSGCHVFLDLYGLRR